MENLTISMIPETINCLRILLRSGQKCAAAMTGFSVDVPARS